MTPVRQLALKLSALAVAAGLSCRCEGSSQRPVFGLIVAPESRQTLHSAALPVQSWQRGSRQRWQAPPTKDSFQHEVQVAARAVGLASLQV